ncbi:MAG: amidase family protein, partial [Anaerotruncus massiliensis (ex Togo et al. 2019)]
MTDERCENHNGKPFVLEEATVASVHEAMLDGRLTCRRLIEGCLARIEAYDKKGPELNAVILVNPHALEEADRLDERFQADGLTGPLHGIPVLLKDNCETFDMSTTAGSLSLEGFETHK